jgi:N-acetylmuramoyl-L-alanine amidase
MYKKGMVALRIAIDVGHGTNNKQPGKYDPGAVSTRNGEEHKVVLGMGNRLKRNLERLGHNVLLIKDLPLGERGPTARAWRADLLVSLHLNAFNRSANGTEVWCNTVFDSRSRRVAKEITSRVAALGFKNRGVKYTDKYAVLKANKHDVLVEICFIDSNADMDRYQKNNAENVELALLNGILVGLRHNAVRTLPRKG